MRTTKRPAWQVTPGTRTLINGKEREIAHNEGIHDRLWLGWGSRWQDGVILHRLAPVLIVLDQQQEAA